MAKKLFSDQELERWSIYWGNPLADPSIMKGSLAPNKSVGEMRIGEGEDMVELDGKMMLEAQDYARVFMSLENKKLLSNLSPRGTHLLFWLMAKVVKGHDLILIDRHQYMKDSGISRQETYMNAVADLVMAKILNKAPRFTDMYFINPHVFFKGSRLMKYRSGLKPENIRYSKNLNKK